MKSALTLIGNLLNVKAIFVLEFCTIWLSILEHFARAPRNDDGIFTSGVSTANQITCLVGQILADRLEFLRDFWSGPILASDDMRTFLIEVITCSTGSEGHFGKFIFKGTNLNKEEQEWCSGTSACLAPMSGPGLHSGTRRHVS